MSTPVQYTPAFFRSQDWWRDETLRDWLTRLVAQRADHTAVLGPDCTLTYAQLREQVRAFAAGLQHAGIRRRDVVAVQLPNVPEFLIAWLAINEIGAVMQTVHTPYGVREVENLLKHSGARAFIALARQKDRSLRDGVLDFVVTVSGEVAGARTFEAVMAQGRENPLELPEIHATDPFLLLYTSGTTSAPKGVCVTFNHFLSNARLCGAELGVTAEDRVLCLAPYTHLYGLYTLQIGLSVGATTCFLDLFTPAGFIQALQQYKPTVLVAGPAHVSPCIQQNLFSTIDLSTIRLAVLSGTTVPPALSAALEEQLPDGKVLQAWGMTELQFGACSRPSDTSDIRFGTVGRATPGTQLRIADTEGDPLATGEPGELQVRGCSLFSGYRGNEDATQSSFTSDGWFRTGDLARMDAQGNIAITGRTKDLINRGGIKFNPVDMEIAIASHPAVAQVAIAPIPDAMLGERAACFVVLKTDASLSLEGLKTFLADRQFAKFTWPEYLAVVAEMPMTPTRKVIKAELVKQYLSLPVQPESPQG